jgi:hypothetical protein
MPEPVKSALRSVGVRTETLEGIRLARGVMGKTSYVAGVALLVLGAIAWHGGSDSLILSLLTVALFAIYYFGSLWFAHKHPGEALLEGAELIQWRQMEMAAKDLPLPPPQPSIEIGSNSDGK